jgi:uncharacterized repeat protein (TIGR01451 family)
VSILLGSGNGTFAAAVNYATGAGTTSVAIGDFDGDGDSDLAVPNAANVATNEVFLLSGIGDGTFTDGAKYPVGADPQAAAIGDFNGDGSADLAVANLSSSNVSILLGNGCPDVAVTKTHSGNFAQGQSGATYTITVRNAGVRPTAGVVTVTDAFPSGLTATGIGGSGWACSLGTLTCTRSDVLGGLTSYPVITLTVDVPTNAPTSVTNVATVTGGGDYFSSNNDASDQTTIVLTPDLTIAKTHTGNFAQGQNGRTYSITIGNAGNAATSSVVTVTDMLPSGLTATGLTGIGWSCTLGTLTCTRSDPLGASGSYPAITLTVNVNDTAPPLLVNAATVSGGGQFFTANDIANDPTTIIVAPANFSATAASTSQIVVTWSAVSGANAYQLFRSSNNGPFVLIASPTVNTFTNTSLTPNTTYVYFARATDGSNTGPPSIRDLATTVLFSDDPLVARSTIVKAVHLTELRTAVNAVRAAAGFAPFLFTDSLTSGLRVKAIHISEMRSSLDEARSALFVPVTPYTDAALSAGTVVKAAHVQELRTGVK